MKTQRLKRTKNNSQINKVFLMFKFIAPFFVLCFLANAANAETFEVKMLNHGTNGMMVFEPDYLKIQPGDKVVFRAVQKGHNAQNIDTMLPEGAAPFKGQISDDLEVTFDKSGFYGIKCTPHYAMGMVMLVKVGTAELPQSYREMKQPGLANKRFAAIFKRIDQGE